ncbi:MAG: hypothetical protein U0796_19735 [Gemmatales bacterium]
MLTRQVVVLLGFGLISLSGCSSLDPCNWWGRNTDGSSNLGRKPTPVQQGPLASTYSRPGNSNTQPSTSSAPVMPPVIVSSPAQAAPPVPQNLPPATLQQPADSSPLSVPSMPPGLGAMDTRQRSSGSFPQASVDTKQNMTTLAVSQPSILSPAQPGLDVKGPAIDLSVPGNPAQPVQQAQLSNNSFPMMLAPGSSSTSAMNSLDRPITMPTIDMPAMNAPNVPEVMMPSLPMTARTGRAATLNPGTTPPAMSPPPSVPTLPQ